MANILDGITLSKKVKSTIKIKVENLISKNLRAPHLTTVLVGENPASMAYVNNKIKDCKAVGFSSSLVKLSENISEEELLNEIAKLNNNPEIDGFIVQLPLPKHIDQEKIIMSIDPKKDVDGFHPLNFGKMALDMQTFIPATPFGIMRMLEEYNISTESKNVVVIGRSRIVGTPMSILMSRKANPGNSTVTTCHSYTKDISFYTKTADIIITALGVPGFLKAEMIKEGAVIVDVGITRQENPEAKNGYKLVGDVDFKNVESKAGWITPVPGGVGPMTRAMLMENTLLAYSKSMKVEI